MKYKILITGWYFEKYISFYKNLIPLSSNIIVCTHKKFVPSFIKDNFSVRKFEDKGGFGLALYQQIYESFDSLQLTKLDMLIFMHDDLFIKDISFPNIFFSKLKSYKLVGNSIEHPLINEFGLIKDYKKYAKGDWFDEVLKIKNFKWKVIDSRCFAVNPETLRLINGFEDCYWGNEIRMSNITLRLFSAKFSYFYGIDSISSLSDEWLRSKYIEEDILESFNKSLLAGFKRFLNKLKKNY